MRPRTRSGFTLVELMMVVAVISILAAVAAPKFSDMVRKSNEGASKGNLGALRSALSIYYADMEGQYPDDLTALTLNGKYIAAIPAARAPNYHAATVSQQVYRVSAVVSDYGGWIYDDIPGDSDYGKVYINCTHTDMKGSSWTSY